jgi:curved DNA-binding protein CbpA
MTKVHSHYENLQVARSASPEVIRAAYKSLSQKYHPDRNPGNSDSTRIMAALNVAYETLSSPEKRQQHDAWIAMTEARNTAFTEGAEKFHPSAMLLLHLLYSFGLGLGRALKKQRKPTSGWVWGVAIVIFFISVGNRPNSPPSPPLPGPKPYVAEPKSMGNAMQARRQQEAALQAQKKLMQRRHDLEVAQIREKNRIKLEAYKENLRLHAEAKGASAASPQRVDAQSNSQAPSPQGDAKPRYDREANAAEGNRKGALAYTQGNYSEALRLSGQSAQQGNEFAQGNLHNLPNQSGNGAKTVNTFTEFIGSVVEVNARYGFAIAQVNRTVQPNARLEIEMNGLKLAGRAEKQKGTTLSVTLDNGEIVSSLVGGRVYVRQ